MKINNKHEIWKDIPEYEGLYQVSNLGNIKSLNKIIIRKGYEQQLKEKILKNVNSNGYKLIALSKNNNSKLYRVHRLIAKAFIPNPDNKPYINHIDGDKHNNHVNNLEWCTAKENSIHRINVLKQISGSKNKTWNNHNFTIEECLQMKQYYNNNISFRKIAKFYNSNHHTISKIIRNEKYNNR